MSITTHPQKKKKAKRTEAKQQNSSNSYNLSTPQQAQRRHSNSESQQKIHKDPQQLPTPASLETNSFHKPPKRPMKIHKNHKEQ